MESYNIFMIVFFHLAKCFQKSIYAVEYISTSFLFIIE